MVGYIYKLTSPKGKVYIGQTVQNVSTRWSDHIRDALGDDHCVALNRAIRKYSPEEFQVEILLTATEVFLDYLETEYIAQYNSLAPCGYNLQLGGANGRHCEQTKEKIRNSLKDRPVSQETRMLLSATTNPELPMYVLHVKKNSQIVGYRVCNHPKGPERRFLSAAQSMSEKLQRAMEYLTFLDTQEGVIQPKAKSEHMYIQKYKDGWVVEYPGNPSKYFVSTKLTTDEKFTLANAYLENLKSMNEVQRLNGSGRSSNDSLKI